jgi:hypothetical protein
MSQHTKPWRYHLPIVSLAPRRAPHDGILQRCIHGLHAVLDEAVARLRGDRSAFHRRHPEPPPIRWEM